MFLKLLVIFMIFFNKVIADEVVKKLTIEELEKEKSKLFEQINIAIDETVKSLYRANDTEAKLGLEYMRNLKEYIEELNTTDNSNDRKGMEFDVDSKSDLENRRSIQRALGYFKKPSKPKSNPFDFEAVLRPRKITDHEWKEMIENRQKMQQKLDLWILEREKEKERRKKLKQEKLKLLMSGKYEKCPRFGYAGKKKREKKNKDRSRIRPCLVEFNITMGKEYEKCPLPDVVEFSSEEKKAKKKRKPSQKYKYPCCRKCCKKSYMGCL